MITCSEALAMLGIAGSYFEREGVQTYEQWKKAYSDFIHTDNSTTLYDSSNQRNSSDN